METQQKRIKIIQPDNNDDTNKNNEFKCNVRNTNYKERKNLNKHITKCLKFNDCYYATSDDPIMQIHNESCKKRRREEDEVEHIAKRAREEEVHSYNQAPIEDELKMSLLMRIKLAFVVLYTIKFGN